jgi:hypothetical protein
MKIILFLGLLLLTLIAVVAPPVMTAKKNVQKAKATNIARSIGITLHEFEAVNDHYPNQNVPEFLLTEYRQQDRNDSNYILGQLIISQALDSEKLFDTGHSRGRSTQADDVTFPLSELLRPGECEFSFVSIEGETPLNSSMTKSETPLLISHIDPNTRKFDENCYSGEFVYLQADNSVAIGIIGPNGKPFIRGKDHRGLFDYGSGTIWGNLKPKIHYPLPYELKATPNSNTIKWGSRTVVLISTALLTFLLIQWCRAPLKSPQSTPVPDPQP